MAAPRWLMMLTLTFTTILTSLSVAARVSLSLRGHSAFLTHHLPLHHHPPHHPHSDARPPHSHPSPAPPHPPLPDLHHHPEPPTLPHLHQQSLPSHPPAHHHPHPTTHPPAHPTSVEARRPRGFENPEESRGQLGTSKGLRFETARPVEHSLGFEISRGLRKTGETNMLGVKTARSIEDSLGFEISRELRDTSESKRLGAEIARPIEDSVGFEIPRGFRETGASKRLGVKTARSIEGSVGFEISSGSTLEVNISEEQSTRIGITSASDAVTSDGLIDNSSGSNEQDSPERTSADFGLSETRPELRRVPPRVNTNRCAGSLGTAERFVEAFGSRAERPGAAAAETESLAEPSGNFSEKRKMLRGRREATSGGVVSGGVTSADRSSSEGLTEDPVGLTNSSEGLPREPLALAEPSGNSAEKRRTSRVKGGRKSSSRVVASDDRSSAERLTEDSSGLTNSSVGSPRDSTASVKSAWNFLKRLVGLSESVTLTGGVARADNSSSEALTEEDSAGLTNSSVGSPRDSTGSVKSPWDFVKELKRLRESRRSTGGIASADNSPSDGLTGDSAGIANSSEGLPRESTAPRKTLWNLYKELKRPRASGGRPREDPASAFKSSSVRPNGDTPRIANSSVGSQNGPARSGDPEVGAATLDGTSDDTTGRHRPRRRRRKRAPKEDKGGRRKGPKRDGKNNHNKKKGDKSPAVELATQPRLSTAPPIIAVKWRPIAVLEGEKVVLKCQAWGVREYSWTLNGVRLKKGKGVKISNKKGASRLTISRVATLHAGILSCQASNSLGESTINTTIRVTSTGHLHPCEPKLQQDYCFNGGTCQRVQGAAVKGLSCMCRAGFSGQRCEQQATPTRLRRDAGVEPRSRPEAPAAILVLGPCLGLLLLSLLLAWIRLLRHRPVSPLPPPSAALKPGEIPPRLPRISAASRLPRISAASELPRISAASELPRISTAPRSHAS